MRRVPRGAGVPSPEIQHAIQIRGLFRAETKSHPFLSEITSLIAGSGLKRESNLGGYLLTCV